MGQARDEAGNIWETDAQGNAVRLVQPASAAGPITVGQRDPFKVKSDVRADDAAARAALAAERAAANDARRIQNENAPKLQPGYMWNDPSDPSKGAKRIPGTENAEGNGGEAKATRDTKLANLRALQVQLDRVNELYAAGPGATSGFAGLADMLPTESNRQFDAAAAGLGDIGNAAFKVPGMGAQSDADAARFVAANQPQASDYDTQIEEKIRTIQQRLDSTMRELGVDPATVAAAQAPAQVQPQVGQQQDQSRMVAPGANYGRRNDGGGGGDPNIVSSPDAGASAMLDGMIRQGKSAGEINARLGPLGYQPVDQGQVASWQKFLRANPTYRDPVGQANRLSSPTMAQQAVASPLGAGFVGAINGSTMGLSDEIAGAAATPFNDKTMVENIAGADAAKQGIRGMNPTSFGLGEVAGGVASSIMLPGANAGRLGLLKDVLTSGSYGAGENNDNRALGFGIGAGGGLVGNKIGTGLAKGFGGALGGVRDPAVNFLANRQVPMTGGQTMGGMFKAVEDKATSVPLLGDLIKARRMEGINAFQDAAFQDAGAPIGFTSPRTGSAGVDLGKAATGQAYDAATGGVRVSPDAQTAIDLAAARNMGGVLPEDLKIKFDKVMDNRVDPALSSGTLTGEDYQQAVRGLKGYKAEVTKPGFEQDYRDALTAAQDALTGTMTRNGGDGVVTGLANADASWRNFKVIEDAVKRARNGSRSGEVEQFMPSQLTDAAEANRYSGTGQSRPFYELSSNAQQVLPSQVPDSGSGGRLLQAALMGTALPATGAGAGYVAGDAQAGGATGLGAILSMAALNTKVGQKALTAALLKRPAVLKNIGGMIVNQAPVAGMIGRSQGAALTPLLLN